MKYTTEELREMANKFLQAMANEDPRALTLIVTMCARTLLSPDKVLDRIVELA